MVRELECLRCSNLMKYVKSEKIQLGEYNCMWGDIPNLLAGALEVDIYICNECGKMEFFRMEEIQESEDDIAQVNCPSCDKPHDIDYPRCPFCKYDYYAE